MTGPGEWPTVLSETRLYLRGSTARRIAAVWMLAFALTSLLITNPYAVAMLRMDPSKADAYRLQLSLVAASFYLVPLLAALVVHDWYVRWHELASRFGGESLPVYARSELVRIAFQSRILAFLAIFTASYLVASTLGLHSLWVRHGKLIGIVLLYIPAALYGLVFVVAGAALARIAREADRAMLAIMILLGVLFVGVPIASDLILAAEIGSMPLPGSPEWYSYLQNISALWGVRIYAISPPELFLVLCTTAFAIGSSPPLWQASTSMVIFLALAWAGFGFVGALTSRRKELPASS